MSNIKLAITDDPHDGNFMQEDSTTSNYLNKFWYRGSAESKTAEIKQESPKKETSAVPAADEAVEEDTSPLLTENNSIIKTEKITTISEIWQELMIAINGLSSEYDVYIKTAQASKFENGVFFILVPTLFSKDYIQKFLLSTIETELKRISSDIKSVKIICAQQAENDELFFVKTNIAMLKDRRVLNVDVRIYGAILSYRNNKTGLCYVGERKISEDFNISRSVVYNSIKNLVNLGYIQKNGESNRISYSFPFVERQEENGAKIKCL